jgi:hypothetical protein
MPFPPAQNSADAKPALPPLESPRTAEESTFCRPERSKAEPRGLSMFSGATVFREGTVILSLRRESMQRAAGTFRMVPDPQTAKRGSGTNSTCNQDRWRFPLWNPFAPRLNRRAWGFPKGNGVASGSSGRPLWPVLWVLSYRHKKVPLPAGIPYLVQENCYFQFSTLNSQFSIKKERCLATLFLFICVRPNRTELMCRGRSGNRSQRRCSR